MPVGGAKECTLASNDCVHVLEIGHGCANASAHRGAQRHLWRCINDNKTCEHECW